MTIYRHPLTSCPACRHSLDAARPTSGDQGEPREGDITVCIRCASYLTFQREGLRLLTQEEIDALDPHTRRELERATAVLQTVGALARNLR